MKPTVYLRQFGCPMRSLNNQVLKELLIENDIKITEDIENADYKILNTCGFAKETIDVSIKEINRAIQYDGKTIVTGCLPGIMPSLIPENPNLYIIPVKDINNLIKLLKLEKKEFFKEPHYYQENNSHGENEYYKLKDILKGFKANKSFFHVIQRRLSLFVQHTKVKDRALFKKQAIKISEGCVLNCSFCGIKHAIGKLRSKSEESIVAEYEQLLNEGFRNLVLLADDTGSWGLDIKKTFPDLLTSLANTDKSKKGQWFLQDLNPFWAVKYQKELAYFIEDGRFFEILFSVQSGSNKILNLMNRKYEIESVVNMLSEFQKLNPRLRMLSNFIIGFPNETEADFQATLDFIGLFNFEFIYLMKYFENETGSSKDIYPKVDEEIIMERIAKAEAYMKKRKIPFRTVY
ncbi:MAG: radical SAM protein [Paludibacteraceae bacterium]|nr:radical SAM protein [Paludibacteraceae bacterium]